MLRLKKIFAVVFIASFMMLSSGVLAQPVVGGPGPGGATGTPYAGPPPCWPPPCIPIDGGVGFLVAAGLALGGKKVYDMRKAQQNKDDHKAE